MNIEEQLKLIEFVQEAYYDNAKQKANQVYQLKLKFAKWQNSECESDANFILWKNILYKLQYIDRLKGKKNKIKKPLVIDGIEYKRIDNQLISVNHPVHSYIAQDPEKGA